MKIKENKWEIILVATILIIQTIIFVMAGINKSYMHMDEAYSLGLTNYNKIDIQANKDFFNNWHSKEYYEDYLTVNEDEKNNFLPVYENQKNDVHPPFYYLLLRIAMNFHLDSYSKWPGLILNMIIYLFITIFMYLIIKIILQGISGIKKCELKSAIITLMSTITLSTINDAIYIRMYALMTLLIVITTYLHLKLLDKKERTLRLFIKIGVTALIGSLTHYYYLFYLIAIFIMFVIKYLKDRNYKELAMYVCTMLIAGTLSLIIFPYSIQHIFFGYRGQSAITNLTDVSQFLMSIGMYFLIINVYAFNNILWILLIFILGIIIYKKVKKIAVIESKNKYIKYIVFPTLCYFVLVAISSPWKDLRYMMPVCNLIFILVFYYLIALLNNIIKEKTLNVVIIVIFILLCIMPIISNNIINLVIGEDFRKEQESSYSSKQEMTINLEAESNIPIDIFSKFSDVPMDNILLFIKNFKIEPPAMFSNNRDILEIIKNNENLPALYVLNSSNERFLDDILLFANIDESYIAKDMEYSVANITEIFKNKNTSNGVLIFINDVQENEKILDTIKEALNLDNIIYLKRLNMCDVYLVK